MEHLLRIILLSSIICICQGTFGQSKVIGVSDYVGAVKDEENLSVYQVIGSDSIVLTDKYEFFWTIEFYQDYRLLFEFKEEVDNQDFEIDTFDDRICHQYKSYYLFKVDKRPSICNSYLVFKRDLNKVTFIGSTDKSSSLIFGDVDQDGYFEIGGFNDLVEPLDLNGTLDTDYYQSAFNVFEINDQIRRDVELENSFKAVIERRLKYSYSGILDSYVFDRSVSDSSVRKYPGASNYIISKESIEKMESSELRLMRNEIFASYGYKFKSKDLQKHFASQEWYSPLYDDVNHKLTEIEKINVQTILEVSKTK